MQLYLITFFLTKGIVEDHDDFKEVIGDILVDVLENHSTEVAMETIQMIILKI